MVKLNVGCWKRNYPGWINIDVLDYPHVHFKISGEDLPMFEDDSVDLVYASHMLEYFTYGDAKAALTEWFRVLKPGGQLNVCVPDFEALVEVYRKYKDPLMLRGSIFAIVDKVLKTDDGIQVFHKMIYDEALLTRLLGECGFTDIKRYDWKEFHAKHLPEGAMDRSASYLPPRAGMLVSLNLEAKKAGPLEATILKAKYSVDHLANKVINKVGRIFRGEVRKRKKDPYTI